MVKPLKEKKQLNSWFYDFLKGKVDSLEESFSEFFIKEEVFKFLEKHKTFFNEKIPLQAVDAFSVKRVQSKDSIQSNDAEIVGKIRITESGISIWVKPELVDSQVVICDFHAANKIFQHNLIGNISKKPTKRDNLISGIAQIFNSNGVILQIPDNLEIKGAFVIEVSSSEDNILIPLRLVCSIGSSASVKILINYSGNKNNHGKQIIFSNNNYFLKKKASLQVFTNQHCNDNIAIFVDEKFNQEEDSFSEIFSLDAGAAVIERNVSVDLNGEGAESIITGVYKPEDGQKYHFDTEQTHKASNTSSDLQYLGVLGKETFISWKGNIVVDQKTTGTNGYQANNTLILDESAKIESIPGLEILTDDVRCSHGVTIGNIDKNHMFYLQSRGINETEAEKLIVDGFLASTKKRVRNQGFLEIISRYL